MKKNWKQKLIGTEDPVRVLVCQVSPEGGSKSLVGRICEVLSVKQKSEGVADDESSDQRKRWSNMCRMRWVRSRETGMKLAGGTRELISDTELACYMCSDVWLIWYFRVNWGHFNLLASSQLLLFFVLFAFVVLGLVSQYHAKRLAGKNVSEMTYLCRVGRKTLINQTLTIRHSSLFHSTLKIPTIPSHHGLLDWPVNMVDSPLDSTDCPVNLPVWLCGHWDWL